MLGVSASERRLHSVLPIEGMIGKVWKAKAPGVTGAAAKEPLLKLMDLIIIRIV